jgi:hypothetical protein
MILLDRDGFKEDACWRFQSGLTSALERGVTSHLEPMDAGNDTKRIDSGFKISGGNNARASIIRAAVCG